MKTRHMLWYGVALLAVALIAMVLGASSSTVLLTLALLACPLMMMLMMGGGHGHGAADDHAADIDRHDRGGTPRHP